jgi:hypothetical protein
VDLADYTRRNVESRFDRLDARVAVIEGDVAVLKTDVAVIKASMATKDDIMGLRHDMYALILPLVLPIYGVLIIILIFLYNAKV